MRLAWVALLLGLVALPARAEPGGDGDPSAEEPSEDDAPGDDDPPPAPTPPGPDEVIEPREQQQREPPVPAVPGPARDSDHRDEAGPMRLYSRAHVGLWQHYSPEAKRGATRLQVGERLRWSLLTNRGVSVELRADGRVGLWVSEGIGPDSVRIRELGVRIDGDAVRTDLGRFRPLHGGFRLVDGAQLLVRSGKGWQVGGWLGLLPDPWDTAPSLRFGGGPVVAWSGRGAWFSLLGEVAGADGAFDRAAALLRAGFRLRSTLTVRGRLELQAPAARGESPLSDALLSVALRPRSGLRIDASWSAWSAWSYLATEVDDPDISRFERRARDLGLADEIPRDHRDWTLHHHVAVGLAWRPLTPPPPRPRVPTALRPLRPSEARPDLSARLRYRHHVLLSHRSVRLDLRAGAVGMIDDRVEIFAEGAVQLQDGGPRGEVGFVARGEIDRGRWLTVDGSAKLLFGRNSRDGEVVPNLYVDAFADLLTPSGWSLAVGYRFDLDSSPGAARTGHAALLRVGWRLRVRGRPR